MICPACEHPIRRHGDSHYWPDYTCIDCNQAAQADRLPMGERCNLTAAEALAAIGGNAP